MIEIIVKGRASDKTAEVIGRMLENRRALLMIPSSIVDVGSDGNIRSC